VTEKNIGFGESEEVGFWKSDGFARPKMGPGDDWLSGIVGKTMSEMLQRAMVDTIEAKLPRVFDWVDDTWASIERKRVLVYVKDTRFRSTACFGWSTCRICGKENGSADFTDGRWKWPEGLAHYIADHNVRPPEPFVRYVLARSK